MEFFNPFITGDRAHGLYFTSGWGCKLGIVTIPTENGGEISCIYRCRWRWYVGVFTIWCLHDDYRFHRNCEPTILKSALGFCFACSCFVSLFLMPGGRGWNEKGVRILTPLTIVKHLALVWIAQSKPVENKLVWLKSRRVKQRKQALFLFANSTPLTLPS